MAEAHSVKEQLMVIGWWKGAVGKGYGVDGWVVGVDRKSVV